MAFELEPIEGLQNALSIDRCKPLYPVVLVCRIRRLFVFDLGTIDYREHPERLGGVARGHMGAGCAIWGGAVRRPNTSFLRALFLYLFRTMIDCYHQLPGTRPGIRVSALLYVQMPTRTNSSNASHNDAPTNAKITQVLMQYPRTPSPQSGHRLQERLLAVVASGYSLPRPHSGVLGTPPDPAPS